MCASPAPAVDKGLQSALRRPGEEGTAGSAAGAHARGGAGSPSPKRVTFALPAPPAGTPAVSAAAAHLQGAQPAARSGGGGSGGSAPGSPLRPPPPVALRPASDELLCFLPEVDTPHRPLSPLGPAPLAAARRWPSNEALVASDAEIAGTVDMSDLPLSPRTPPASPAGLAQAFFDLMPQQRLARATSADQQGSAAVEASEAAEAAASAAGEHSAFAATAAEAEAGAATPLAALTGLLCRFLSAAATSGSSIAELAATNTGSRLCSGFSRSPSVDTLYSARSSCSELSTYGSACSDDEL